MKRNAVLGFLCLTLITGGQPIFAADGGEDKGVIAPPATPGPEAPPAAGTAAKAAKSTGQSWYDHDPLYKEVMHNPNVDAATKAKIRKSYSDHGKKRQAVFDDADLRKEVQAKLDEAKAKGPAKPKKSVIKADKPAPLKSKAPKLKIQAAGGAGIVAEPPPPEEPAPPIEGGGHEKGIAEKSGDTQGAYCATCHAHDNDPIPPRTQRDLGAVRDALPPIDPPVRTVYRDAEPAPAPRENGGGGGLFGGISSSNLMWGLGGALVGGFLGYKFGQNSAYNSMYGQYGGYQGFQQAGYNPYAQGYGMGPGGLPNAYRLGGGMGAPQFQPYIGNSYMPGYYSSGINGQAPGYYMGAGAPYTPGGTAFPVSGYSPGGVYGGGYGASTAGALCTNCTLPTMYPVPASPFR